ncbi:MAG: DUF58 domain-containing protein [Candidatus Delongbacteria bacterium]|nr:DUF58 domain-containing protein [Candidatus Delongbacteria bacterium]
MSAKFFYNSYAKFSKRGRKIRLSVTPFGLLVVSICIISGFAGLNLTVSFLYRLFTLSLSLLIISYLSRNKDFDNIQIKLFFSKQFPVGERAKYLIKIYNYRKADIHDICIIPVVKEIIPTLDEFVNVKEPNEDKRNIWDRNVYTYRWMWHIIRLFKAEFHAIDVKTVSAGSFYECDSVFEPVKRGKIYITGVFITKKDIFGLFNTSKYFELNENITILPRRYEIDKKTVNSIKSDIDRTKNSLYNILHKHKTGDFIGLRSYVPGDPIRNIHWKSWAKTNRPTVIEKGFGKVNEFNIVLFNLISTENNNSAIKFEDSLSFVYSLLEYFSKNWFTVNFYYFHKNELKSITACNDKGNYPILNEIICRIDYYIVAEIEKITNQLKKKLKKHSNTFIILTEDNENIIRSIKYFDPIIASNTDKETNKNRMIRIPEVNTNVEQITIL